jgi:hypothetical protein
MKTRYHIVVNCEGYHEGDKVWLYCQTCTKRT